MELPPRADPDEQGGSPGSSTRPMRSPRRSRSSAACPSRSSLADRLRGLHDPEEVKQAAAEMLGYYLGAARVGYAEVDEAQGRRLRPARLDARSDGAEPGRPAHRASPLRRGGAGLLARPASCSPSPTSAAAPRLAPSAPPPGKRLGVRALITVPLVRDGGAQGAALRPRARGRARGKGPTRRSPATSPSAAGRRSSGRGPSSRWRERGSLPPHRRAEPAGDLDGRARRPARPGRRALERLDRHAAGSAAAGSRASIPTTAQPSLRRLEPHASPPASPTTSSIGCRWSTAATAGRARAPSRAATARATICLWYGSTEDIHERKVAEEHQRLLINELNHRVKNTLATVQAIAFQTLKGEVPLAEARARFEARLMALSRAHNLLTEENWGGAALERVVSDATEHLADEARRVRRRRRAAPARPARRARAGAGAARARHQRRQIWRALRPTAAGSRSPGAPRADRLRLEWRESGGPPVVAPGRRGFGSRLIERGLAADLGGTRRAPFRSRRPALRDRGLAGRDPGAGAGAWLSRRLRILVVEDEMLVAMNIEDMLLELGHEVAGLASRLGPGAGAGARGAVRRRDARRQPRRRAELPGRRPAGRARHPLPVRDRLRPRRASRNAIAAARCCRSRSARRSWGRLWRLYPPCLRSGWGGGPPVAWWRGTGTGLRDLPLHHASHGPPSPSDDGEDQSPRKVAKSSSDARSVRHRLIAASSSA